MEETPPQTDNVHTKNNFKNIKKTDTTTLHWPSAYTYYIDSILE